MVRFMFFLLVIVMTGAPAAHAAVAGYEELILAQESYWNGSDSSGGFTSAGIFHTNNYDTQYGSWDGFAYSNRTDTSTTGWDGQYTAYSNGGNGGGVDDSSNYAIGYVGWAIPPIVNLSIPFGAYFANNAYAYSSMLAGDAYSKKFGGVSGDDDDWFLLTIEGIDAANQSTGTVDFYLADYRFADNSFDYIVSDWTWVDLSSLGTVSRLEFGLSSSDVGDWGMNTPAYFAMDNLNAVPIPGALWLLAGGLMGLMGIRRKIG